MQSWKISCIRVWLVAFQLAELIAQFSRAGNWDLKGIFKFFFQEDPNSYKMSNLEHQKKNWVSMNGMACQHTSQRCFYAGKITRMAIHFYVKKTALASKVVLHEAQHFFLQKRWKKGRSWRQMTTTLCYHPTEGSWVFLCTKISFFVSWLFVKPNL